MARPFARQFYRSELWQKTRDYILLRDAYLCQECGAPAEEVHHKIHLSPSNIGDPKVTVNPDNLVSLCRDCHFAEHKRDKARGNAERAQGAAGDEYMFDENGFLVRKSPPGPT